MKRRLLLVAITLLAAWTSGAQSLIWQKNYGGSGLDIANSVQQTADSGYILTGMSYSTDGDVHFSNGNTWMLKTDALGAIKWEHCYSDPLYYSTGESVIQTNDSGYAMIGTFINAMGVYYTFVIKTDDTGGVMWQQNLADATNSASLFQTADGGYIIGATGDSSFPAGSNGLYDFTLTKLDNQGRVRWQRTYGDTTSEHLYKVRPARDGGFIMAGTKETGGPVNGNLPNTDFYIVKADSLGAVQWEKTYGGSEADIAYDVQQTMDGGYVIAGLTHSSDGSVTGNHSASPDRADAWVLKIDSAGTLQWQQALGGSGDDAAYSIIQAADSEYVLAGMNSSNDGDVHGNHLYASDPSKDCWVVKLSTSGAIRWTKSLGGTDMDEGRAVIQAADGSFMIAGYAYSDNGDLSSNYGQSDYCVFKLDGTPLIGTGVAALQSGTSVSAYPNPTHGRLTVHTLERGRLSLTDMQGRQIASYKLDGGITPMQLPKLAPGIYALRFLGASGAMHMLRIVYQP